MRARAQKNRWEEELPRSEHEMLWTTLYFMHQRDKWYSRLVTLRKTLERGWGHEAYCEKMIFRWEELSRLAEIQYRVANPNFPATWIPLIPDM
jgi:hypothetical protein